MWTPKAFQDANMPLTDNPSPPKRRTAAAPDDVRKVLDAFQGDHWSVRLFALYLVTRRRVVGVTLWALVGAAASHYLRWPPP